MLFSDDGIAVGCCAYGLFGNHANAVNSAYKGTGATLWQEPLSPYLGPAYDEYDIDEAIAVAEPWLDIERVPDETRRLEIVSNEISSAGVIAWFHGRLVIRLLYSLFSFLYLLLILP